MKSTEQPERGTEKLKTKTNTTKLQETEAGSGMPFITFQTCLSLAWMTWVLGILPSLPSSSGVRNVHCQAWHYVNFEDSV